MEDYFSNTDWEIFQSHIKKYDDGNFTRKQISEELNWAKNKAKIFTDYLIQLSKEEIDLIIEFKKPINLNLLQAVILQEDANRRILFNKIDRIINADLPLREIKIIIDENKSPDRKEDIDSKYWKEVALYIEQLEVDEKPFNKNAKGFLKGISYKEYASLSIKQIKWLDGLIAADKDNSVNRRYFVNDHLIQKGFEKECSIIKNIWDVT
jgi:hypothetical protein